MLNSLVGPTPQGVYPASVYKTLTESFAFATKALAAEGIRALVEALNHNAVPGFHIVHIDDII